MTRHAAQSVLTAAALLALPYVVHAVSLSAHSLTVFWDAGQIGVSAPAFHFLTGKALDRLHDGVALAFDAQLSLMASPVQPPLDRSVDRFLVSYDLWEEKFAVTRLRDPHDSASHLTADAAEVWCIARMRIHPGGVDPSRPLTVRLDLRAEDNQDSSPLLGDPGLNLASLIEIFSRPARSQQQRWQLDSPPFRVRDLAR